MLAPAPHPAETQRLLELHQLCLLDTAPEHRFDRVTRLARRLFDVDFALVSLVDAERQWFKSKQGLAVSETGRDVSFCGHAILQEQVLVVEDALRDPRFADNPLVTGAPHIRFYAGVPVKGPAGHPVGTLCVIGIRPRRFSAEDDAALRDLGELVEAELGATSLARSRRAALLSEARLGAVIDNIHDGIITTDADGAIASINRAALRIFDYPADELIGRSVLQLMPEPFRSQHGPALSAFLSDSAARSDGADRTVSGRRRDGDVFPMELAISAFSCAGQRGYAGIVRDVSDARRRQRELLAATRDAELAAQAKGDFLANMSHEIRSPLNAILGLSHLLGTTPLSADQRGYLDMVASSGQSLLAILNDILDFSKIEAGQMALAPAPVLLSELLRPLATMMSVTAGDKDLELLIGVAPGVPPAYVGDPLRLHQVLLNLLANAIKFTERGAVTLLVDCPARRDSSAALRFRVRDSGIGISAEQQGRLFQAFTQADTSTTRRFGGTGLGLSIAHRLATMMGGTITVDSELGRGSEFCFALDLPLAPDGAVATAAPPCDAGLRVLLAGDHAGANGHLADMVAPWRWSLTEAGSGTQALALLLAAAGDGRAYDLLLVDGNSAAVDAPALLRALQDAPPAGGRPLTILMANAYARGKLVQAGAPGIDASLTKPAIAANLLHALAQARALRRDGAAGPGASGPPAARQRVAGRFLLVEDNLLNQIVASGLLRRAGAEVDIAANGQRALELLRAAPRRYQMVLMDVQMPVMDGMQATRAIRQQLALTLPVIAMTAGVLDNERRQCLDAGMSDFIAKPLDLDAMFATIARHLPASTPPGPPTAARGPQAPADDAVFDVEQLCPADEPGTNAGMVDLIARILAEAQVSFDTANAAWRGGDPLLAAQTLHAMRGNIGALGASRFVRASRLAEAALAEQPAELITPLFDDAGAALAEALAAGAAWLAGKRAPIP